MKTQYGKDGLKIIRVDEAYRDPLEEKSEAALMNFIYDNELEEIPLLLDNKISDVAGKYGIHVLPTTFLIAKDGTIDQIWENTALSSQLDLAIRDQIKGRALDPASNRDDEWSPLLT